MPFFFLGFVSYSGLVAGDSNVFLYDCQVEGSSGAPAHSEVFLDIPPGTSGTGVSLNGSTLFAVGCSMSGGDGGGDPLGKCYAGEDGSPGLRLAGGSVAHLQDCSVLGGTGGAGGCGQPAGADAPALEVDSGTLDQVPGAARAFSGASPVVEGTTTSVHLAGEPGDAVLLHVEGEPGDAVLLHVQLAASTAHFLPALGIAVHLPFPHAVIDLGPLPPSGALDLDFPVPPLAPGVESFRAVGEAVFVGATGVFDGGPSRLLIVGAAL